MYWVSINTTDYKEAKKLFVSAGQDIVAYLEYKFYEDYEEALARDVPLVEDGEELSEHQFFMLSCIASLSSKILMKMSGGQLATS
jgi:hypothetical protein